jgi:signal transduction histidine kinase
MTLGRLKWVAVVAPVLALAILWVLLHTVLEPLDAFPQALGLLGLLAAGVLLFATVVFSFIERLERRILDQNAELEQRNRELAAMLRVGRAAYTSLDLDTMLDAAMDATLSVTGADAVEVWLANGAGDLALVGHRGPTRDEIVRIGAGEALSRLAARRGAAIVSHDLPEEARGLADEMAGRGLPGFCVLPLSHRDETLGALLVASRAPERLRAQHEIRLLEGIGERVAPAIAIARLHERVLDGAVVDERLRLAHELHDGLAQVLGYINTQTLAVRKLLSAGRTEAAREELAAMEAAARDVYGDIREAILGLRVALPREGLVAGVRQYVDGYRAMTGADISIETRGELDDVVLTSSAEIQLVRIVQEALSNMRKHAGAAHGRILVSAEDGVLEVSVSDDGRGFDPGATTARGWPRFGLQTMRERALAVGGLLEIDSSPGRGTTVSVRIPVESEVAHARAAG